MTELHQSSNTPYETAAIQRNILKLFQPFHQMWKGTPTEQLPIKSFKIFFVFLPFCYFCYFLLGPNKNNTQQQCLRQHLATSQPQPTQPPRSTSKHGNNAGSDAQLSAISTTEEVCTAPLVFSKRWKRKFKVPSAGFLRDFFCAKFLNRQKNHFFLGWQGCVIVEKQRITNRNTIIPNDFLLNTLL